MQSNDITTQPSGTARKAGFIALTIAYLLLVTACLGTLVAENEISMGRNPVENLIKTAHDFIRQRFVDVCLCVLVFIFDLMWMFLFHFRQRYSIIAF